MDVRKSRARTPRAYLSHQIANVDLLETRFCFLCFLDPAVLITLPKVVWLQMRKYTPVVKICLGE